MRQTVLIDGLADLRQTLLELDKVLLRPESAVVVRAAARKIRDGARRRAPKGKSEGYSRIWRKEFGMADRKWEKFTHQRKPGSLKRGIIGGARVGKSGTQQIVSYVKVNYKTKDGPIAPHGHLVEFGTAERRPKKRKYMSFVAGSNVVFARRADPVPARPYFRVAVQSDGPTALAAAQMQFDRIIRRVGLAK